MRKTKRKPQQATTQKQKLKLSTVLLIAAGVSFFVASVIFISIGIFESEETKAQKTSSEVFSKPTDFNCPQLLVRQADLRMNGVRIKKYISTEQSNP